MGLTHVNYERADALAPHGSKTPTREWWCNMTPKTSGRCRSFLPILIDLIANTEVIR
jgi:hypothetical protein